MPATLLGEALHRTKLAAFAACFVGTIGTAAAADAPRALFNKSVTLSWSEYRVQRCDSGDMKRGNTDSVMQVYISAEGRLFSRLNRGDGRSANSTDSDPEGGESRNGTGASRLTTHFEDQQLMIDTPMRRGARRVQVSFDAGFATCRLDVRFGKEGGQELYHRTMDGQMCTIIGTDVSHPSCAIQSGNAFAGH